MSILYQHEVFMQFLFFVLAGLAGGVLAGMGMGGGTLTLPLLVLALNVGQFTAQFANLIAFLPSGTAALAVHAKNGLVQKNDLVYMLLPSIAACVVCSFFATKAEGELLKKLYGVFLVVIAVVSFGGKVASKNRAI